MIQMQEHIINKIFLEVNTNSSSVAHDLKDHLGMFLKKDILPYLEDYLATIEHSLPAEIVQIPQLTIDLSVKKQHDFKDLKNDTKEKLVKKIDAILKTPSQVTEDIVLINAKEHQTRSLLFFIEHGYGAWWRSSEAKSSFTKERLEVASIMSSFVKLLLASEDLHQAP